MTTDFKQLPFEIQKIVLGYIPAHNVSAKDLITLPRGHFWFLLHWDLKIRYMEWRNELEGDVADGPLVFGVGQVGDKEGEEESDDKPAERQVFHAEVDGEPL